MGPHMIRRIFQILGPVTSAVHHKIVGLQKILGKHLTKQSVEISSQQHLQIRFVLMIQTVRHVKMFLIDIKMLGLLEINPVPV